MGFGWLHDGKDFVQPASKEQVEAFERDGFVPHPLDRQATHPRRLVIRPRESPPRTFGPKLPGPGEPGYPKAPPITR